MKINKVRVLGVLLIIATVTIQYTAATNEYGFLLGVLTAIGLVFLTEGRTNIFRRNKTSENQLKPPL